MARALVAAAALVLTTLGGRAWGAPPTLADYDFNGQTTYCYWINQGPNITNFDYAYVKLQAKGNDCPLLVNIQQTTTGVILPNSDVQYQFTATLNFNDNKFGMTQLEAIVPDPATGRPVQIIHANVHACSRTTLCDVFHDGANRRISNQETANFTNDKATFVQKVNFAVPGEYNVFAHIVLPPKNAATETYQFVTFTTTTITPQSTPAPSGGGTSTGVMVAAILGAIVVLSGIVVGVIFYRRKHPPNMMAPGNDHFRHSGMYAPSQTAKSKASRLDWNGDPEFQFGHDRYQASMVSEYSKQAPALSASALMFQDNGSSRNGRVKTASSGAGSSHRSNSPRFRDPERFDTYDRFGSDNDTIQSYATDTSVGTSNAFPSDAHMYGPNGGPSSRRGGPYGYGQTDLSMNDFYNDHDTLGPVSEMDRDSVASMGTVDFALPPPLASSGVRATGDSFQAQDVPNLADTKLAFNDEEISKQTIEYIDSLRQQNYRDTDQASDYVSDFGDTKRTFDFRDSDKSDQVYGASFQSVSDDHFDDPQFQKNKRTDSSDSEAYEF